MVTRLRWLAPILALLLLVPGPAAAQGSGDVVEGDLGKELDRAVQVTTMGGFWGAVLVAKEGKVVLAKGYGNADYGSKPNTPRTLFEIASLSKQFTAAAILKLEMQGRLATTDPIARFFPKCPEDKRAITVHQLVTHTSGISPEIALPYASTASRDELVAHVLEPALLTPPGEAFAYCNAAYALLAAIIEVASGRPFEVYLEAEIFAPAGMKDTGFVRGKGLDPRRTSARVDRTAQQEDWTAVNWFWGWGYRGMGGVVTTAYDLLAWDRALRGVKVLDAKAKEKIFQPALASYAYGWSVGVDPQGRSRVEHGGGVLGYACHMARWLDSETVVIVLSNGSADLMGVTGAIAERLSPRPILEADIDVSPYALNPHQAVVFPEGTRLSVETKGGLRFVFEDAKTKHAIGTVKFPAGYEKTIVERLDEAIRGGADDEAAEKAPFECGIFLGGYDVSKMPLNLTRTIDLGFMPRYDGQDDQGNPVSDARVVMVLGDSATGQWPIMAKMNRRQATELLERLRKLVR